MSITKRMIYYYFGSKEDLYVAVLERAYRGIREAERALSSSDLAPVEALREVAQLTFDHHHRHPAFIRIVAVETSTTAPIYARSAGWPTLAPPQPRLLEEILERGRVDGTLRGDVDALDVHMVISSYCVFQIANNHTFGYLFDRDMQSPGTRQHNRELLGDLVVSWLRRPPDAIRRERGRRVVPPVRSVTRSHGLI